MSRTALPGVRVRLFVQRGGYHRPDKVSNFTNVRRPSAVAQPHRAGLSSLQGPVEAALVPRNTRERIAESAEQHHHK